MTYAQARVLAAVREIGSDGWPVSVREVCDRLGLASPSTAHAHLHALEFAGHVARSPRGGRYGWRPATLVEDPPPLPMTVQISTSFGWRTIEPRSRAQFEIGSDILRLSVDGRAVRGPWRVITDGRIVGTSP